MKMKTLPSITLLGAVLSTLWLGPGLLADDPGAGPERTLALEPCHIPNRSQEALCGSHTVFENRATAQGRQIDIQFAVLPAVDETSEPDPLVFFAGGPGQASMEMAQFVATAFPSVIESRDVVLIDQRGMGSSHPLDCEEPEDTPWTLTTEERRQLTREVLTGCLTELDADVTLYTQDLANEDIHEILLALGYDKVNLYGVSWGTRSALLYAHQFPEHVRTTILDGSLPLSNSAPLHAAADGERALNELLTDCDEDPACADAFPTLRQDFQSAWQRLGTDGESVTFSDPTTGETQTLLLTQGAFGEMLRSILYSSDLSRIAPIIIHQVANDDYRGLMGVAAFLTGATSGGMTLGASLTIFCSEEVARMEATELEQEAAPRLLGHQILTDIKTGCEVWPQAPLPAIYKEAVRSEAPTLILSGEVDPITPPRWGEEIAKALPNSLHLVAPATGHNVGPRGCASELMGRLIDQGSLDGISGDCLQDLTRPTFFIDLSGPQAVSTASDDDASDDTASEDDTSDDNSPSVSHD